MKECHAERNKTGCNCTYELCSRKGVCCECIRYHLEADEVPACFFPPEIERTFDRSIDRFISTRRKKSA